MREEGEGGILNLRDVPDDQFSTGFVHKKLLNSTRNMNFIFKFF